MNEILLAELKRAYENGEIPYDKIPELYRSQIDEKEG